LNGANSYNMTKSWSHEQYVLYTKCSPLMRLHGLSRKIDEVKVVMIVQVKSRWTKEVLS